MSDNMANEVVLMNLLTELLTQEVSDTAKQRPE